MRVTLTPDQIISLRNFLMNSTQEKPTNYSEWGKEWEDVCNVRDHLNKFIKEFTLICNSDYFYSIFNWLAHYVDDIKRFQLGEELFNEMSQLFIVLHVASHSKFPYYIFISTSYNSQPEPVFVDPYSDPADFFKDFTQL